MLAGSTFPTPTPPLLIAYPESHVTPNTHHDASSACLTASGLPCEAEAAGLSARPAPPSCLICSLTNAHSREPAFPRSTSRCISVSLTGRWQATTLFGVFPPLDIPASSLCPLPYSCGPTLNGKSPIPIPRFPALGLSCHFNPGPSAVVVSSPGGCSHHHCYAPDTTGTYRRPKSPCHLPVRASLNPVSPHHLTSLARCGPCQTSQWTIPATPSSVAESVRRPDTI